MATSGGGKASGSFTMSFSAEVNAVTFHIHNQLAPDKKFSNATNHTFAACEDDWGFRQFLPLQDIVHPAGAWLVNDCLILSVDSTVAHTQLDTGGMPCDVTLKLPCGAKVPAVGTFLQSASPFFCDILEDVHVQGTAPIPVGGSLSAWTCILSDAYPPHDPPPLNMRDAYVRIRIRAAAVGAQVQLH
ncbi:hypothetical protein FOA52_011970 [Chlamydomonas sp. UWO 241]|nr:hypothetical protein FOA52_011970 [Chlamydomonas sp. UWO 241]